MPSDFARLNSAFLGIHHATKNQIRAAIFAPSNLQPCETKTFSLAQNTLSEASHHIPPFKGSTVYDFLRLSLASRESRIGTFLIIRATH